MGFINSELEKAVIAGDIEFLKRAIKLPRNDDYFLAQQEYWGVNIFHMAAFWNNAEFLREALRILPPHLVQQLLSSQ